MTFREDESRIRKKQGSLAFNMVRKISMASLKYDDTKQVSMAQKTRTY